MKVLMVLASHDQLGNTGRKTGFWLEELSAASLKMPDGKPLVEGKKVTGFTDGEEQDIGLTNVAPFVVEDELISLGATFSKVKNWGVHTVADRRLITGQNPAASGPA